MRILILFSLLLLAVTVANTAVRTVSNNASIPAQYDNLQTAIDESAAGDTVYVSWSNTTYGNIDLEKQLVLIGDGYNQGLAGRSTTLDNLKISQVDNNNNCTGSIIQGFSINSLFSGIPNSGLPADDLIFLRNRFRSYIYFYDPNTSVHKLNSGWYFKDCIFEFYLFFSDSPTNRFAGAEDVIFSNSVFMLPIYYMGNPTAFINCMFVDFWKSSDMFGDIENALFTSCIFLSVPRTLNNSTFNNCLTFCDGDNTIPYGTNTGDDNIIDEDPDFVNLDGKTWGNFDYLTHDATLESTSPAIGTGLDGVDMGVFGGTNPLPNFSGEPSIPLITSMTILNSVVGKNGSLRFKINAKNNK